MNADPGAIPAAPLVATAERSARVIVTGMSLRRVAVADAAVAMIDVVATHKVGRRAGSRAATLAFQISDEHNRTGDATTIRYMNPSLLPLVDYQRIYEVAYSVLHAMGTARVHRSCMFFAILGTTLLREHYGMDATIGTGCLALLVDEHKEGLLFYGRVESGVVVNDVNAFHAWVECDGWLIDFMAPIMGVAAREDGFGLEVPRRMLQKPLAAAKASSADLKRVGDYLCIHDAALANEIIDLQPPQVFELMKLARRWFRKPPEPMPRLPWSSANVLGGHLTAQAPSIEGAW